MKDELKWREECGIFIAQRCGFTYKCAPHSQLHYWESFVYPTGCAPFMAVAADLSMAQRDCQEHANVVFQQITKVEEQELRKREKLVNALRFLRKEIAGDYVREGVIDEAFKALEEKEEAK